MRGVIRDMDGETCYFLDDVQVTKEMYDAYFPSKLFAVPVRYTKEEIEEFVKAGTASEITPEMKKRLPKGYPIKSVALAVHSSQVREAMEDAMKRGVPTMFTPSGRPILRDAAHRKAYLKAYGFHDRNSYNGY